MSLGAKKPKRQCYLSMAMQEFNNTYEYRNLLPLAESDMEKMPWTSVHFRLSTHSLFSGDSFSSASNQILLQPPSDLGLSEEKAGPITLYLNGAW